MERIKLAVDDKTKFTSKQILQIFEQVGAVGNIILFKHDASRSRNRYTVVIMSPTFEFETIRHDAISLDLALSKCMQKYFEVFSVRAK